MCSIVGEKGGRRMLDAKRCVKLLFLIVTSSYILYGRAIIVHSKEKNFLNTNIFESSKLEHRTDFYVNDYYKKKL